MRYHRKWGIVIKKVYVDIIAQYGKDGRVTPLTIIWEDGQGYEIEKIRDVRNAASLKVGGTGVRYTVMLQGKEKYLFFDTNENKWFVEAK